MKQANKKARPRPDERSRFLNVGGRLAVDFVNSVYSPIGPDAALRDWEGLVEFLAEAKVISPERAVDLLAWKHSAPQALPALVEKALRLRVAIRSSLEARIAGTPIGEAMVEPINDVLAITEGHDELVWEDGEWGLKFHAREEAIEWLLAAIARSAAEIIAEGADAPLRRCANPSCGVLFYDTSRNGRRRWCMMNLCGNRNKVAAFARRHSRRRR